MFNNCSQNINYNEIEGITKPDKFKDLIDLKIEIAKNTDRTFSLFILEINLIYANLLNSNYDIKKLIGKIIRKNIRKEDEFTIDKNGRYIVLLSDTLPASLYMPINRILNEIQKYIGNFADINIGIANAPLDGINYNYLHKSLLESLEESQRNNLNAFKKSENIPDSAKKTYQIIEQSKNNYIKLISLIEKINNYSPDLKTHTARVTTGAVNLAQKLNLDWEAIEKIAVSSILHDIGYIKIPLDYYTRKKEDNEIIKFLQMHPIIASKEILKPIGIFENYISLIENHHELLDGSGFPKGKQYAQIEPEAQIISIIDSYCSLIIENTEPQKSKLRDIIEIYNNSAKINWNEDIVTAFTSMIEDPMIRNKILTSANIGE